MFSPRIVVIIPPLVEAKRKEKKENSQRRKTQVWLRGKNGRTNLISRKHSVHCTLLGLTSVVYKSSSRLIRLLSSFISRFRGLALPLLLIIGDSTKEGSGVALHMVGSSGSNGEFAVEIAGEVLVLSPTRVEVASVSHRSSSWG